MNDPLFSNVALLLHLDGDAGSRSMYDSSSSFKTATAVGGAAISTAISRFGGASLALDGGGDYLSVQASADFQFVDNNFTIEAWIYPQAAGGSILSTVGPDLGFSRNGDFDIFMNPANRYIGANFGAGSKATAGTIAVPLETWSHIALARSGFNVTLYVNGAVSGTFSVLGTPLSSFKTSPLLVGASVKYTAPYNVQAFFQGFIDEVRVTSGVTRYTAAFSPPAAGFAGLAIDPSFASTSLLLHCDGADNGMVFPDEGNNPKVLTGVGSAQTNVIWKKFGATAIYFPTATANVSTPASVDFDFGAGDFTVEAWAYLRSSAAFSPFITYGGSSIDGHSFQLTAEAGVPSTRVFAGGVAYTCASTLGAMATDQWYHLAVTRSAGTLRLFVDGVQGQAVAITGAVPVSTVALNLGRNVFGNGGSAVSLVGNLDEVRISKGLARYTAAFSAPTEPFPGPASARVLAPMARLSSGYAFNGQMFLVAPSPPMAQATGHEGFNSAALTALMGGVAAHFGGFASVTAPSPTVFAQGHDSTGENSFGYTAPSPTLDAYGGANADLTAPTPTLSLTATVTNFGTMVLAAPSPVLIANGRVGGAAAAYLTTTEPYKLVGYSGAVCSITLTGMATLQATGTTGSIGYAALSVPLFELTASGTAQNRGSANLLAPSPQMGATAQAWLIAPAGQLTAIGRAVVAVTYEAYAVNLKHKPKRGVEPTDEVTRYTSFPFTQIVRYQNSYFGVAADGLYLLEGTTDAGAAIPYAAKTAISDFDASEKKTILSAYFGGRIGPDMTVTLYAGEAGQEVYPYTTPRGQAAQNHREKFARGVKNRYYALGVAGTGELELDSIELEISKLTRRI